MARTRAGERRAKDSTHKEQKASDYLGMGGGLDVILPSSHFPDNERGIVLPKVTQLELAEQPQTLGFWLSVQPVPLPHGR